MSNLQLNYEDIVGAIWFLSLEEILIRKKGSPWQVEQQLLEASRALIRHKFVKRLPMVIITSPLLKLGAGKSFLFQNEMIHRVVISMRQFT